MKKIILKAKLKDYDKFEDRLSEIDLEFGPVYWQHDRVYTPRGFRRGMNFPRLVMRTEIHAVDEPPKYFLILRRHIEDSGVDIVEKTPVEDYTSAVNTILQLGFKQAGEVSRRRQTLDMGDGAIIHLDEIDGKNEAYAKIESILNPKDSVEAVKTDLKKTFGVLGESNFVDFPYFEIQNREMN